MDIIKNITCMCVILLIINLPKINGFLTKKLVEDARRSQCLFLPETKTLKCPSTNSKMVIFLMSSKITCYDDIDYQEFKEILPNITMDFTNTLKIKDCPLPDSLPISSITKLLGIDIRNLIFESNNKWSANLSHYHLSNLNTLKHLKLELDRVTTIPENLFVGESFANLTALNISTNSNELPINIFMNLKNLEYLSVKFLQSLPMDIFRFQAKLLRLHLSNGKLKNISKDLFRFNSRLTDIVLESNQIETLSPDVFESLKNLRIISFRNNSIRILPENLIRNNTNLQVFELSHNRVPLNSIPSTFLADFPFLKDVTLRCYLDIIPKNLFRNSKFISFISLSYNNLENLPETLFKSQKFLNYLDLSHNNLTFLPKKLFKNNKRLADLDMSHNKLHTFTSQITLPSRHLNTLDVSHNELTAENITISQFDQIFSLILGNNLINYIPKHWKMSRKMQLLDLGNNNISILNVNDVFNSLTRKLVLILNNNNITTININISSITKGLTADSPNLTISLNNNPIRCDCNLLDFVKLLKGEDVDYQLLRHLQFGVANLTCTESQNNKGKLVKSMNNKEFVCDNYKYCPKHCYCGIRSYDMILVVNCTNLKLTSIPSLPNIEEHHLNGIELNVENNQIMNLPSLPIPGYDHVTKLFAAFNNLNSVQISQMPTNLTYLDVRGNYLKTLSDDMMKFMNESTSLQKVYLSNNSWLCECDDIPLIRFIQSSIPLVKDFSNMTCANKEKLTYFDDLQYLQDLCSNETYFPIIYLVLAILVAVVCLSLSLYCKYQLEIKIWLYARNMCLWFVTEDELDKDKKYDAFISYSHKDEDFVIDILVPELENGHPSFKVCVHYRDWLVGACIPDQIINSVRNSKKTIFILSTSFVESLWAKMEFKAAHQAALKDGISRVIVIIYKDIGDIDKLDSDLKAYLKMNTYLEWGDPLFWKKLRYAMPHIKNCNRSVENISLNEIRK